MIPNFYRVVGVMSGTSLDGLDLAFCEFHKEDSRWVYHVKVAETTQYPYAWKTRLKNAVNASGLDLALLNSDYGHYLGRQIRRFIDKNRLEVDLVAVHGHTIFHQPDKLLTLQIGDGAAIASYLSCPVVNRFRNVDVALGGQGAPLVPIGDKHLFNTADFCLNLGGIANISYTDNDKTTAFDVCVCNMALNYLAADRGFEYDEDGRLASFGKLNTALLEQFGNMDFLRKPPPKSLGFEWFMEEFLPLLNASDSSTEDKLHTVCEHIARQISTVVNAQPAVSSKTMIVTGGGAKNVYLMSRIQQLCRCRIEESNPLIIDFKESLIFAFLGVLRLREEPNCIASVTGAKRDNIGGCIYLGNCPKDSTT